MRPCIQDSFFIFPLLIFLFNWYENKVIFVDSMSAKILYQFFKYKYEEQSCLYKENVIVSCTCIRSYSEAVSTPYVCKSSVVNVGTIKLMHVRRQDKHPDDVASNGRNEITFSFKAKTGETIRMLDPRHIPFHSWPPPFGSKPSSPSFLRSTHA
jgi:hypothetical protein